MDRLVFDGKEWHEGNPPLVGVLSQSYMHGSVVFDGARAFSGCVPDLDLHCARLLVSADALGLDKTIDVDAMVELGLEGVRRFEDGAELYIRPSFFAEGGFLTPEPGTTRFAMAFMRMAMPAGNGGSVCLSPFRRPWPDMAPTDAKAACLYPNSSRALLDAEKRGFDNAVMRDGDGNVVEFASANLWIVRDGLALTPEWNRTFLNGITKQRVAKLLNEKGIEVREIPISVDDVAGADEVFSTGNYGKVLPITRFEEHEYEIGPVVSAAREAYFAYAKTASF